MDEQEAQIINISTPQNHSGLHVFLLLIPAIIFVTVLAFFSIQLSREPQVLSTEAQNVE